MISTVKWKFSLTKASLKSKQLWKQQLQLLRRLAMISKDDCSSQWCRGTQLRHHNTEFFLDRTLREPLQL